MSCVQSSLQASIPPAKPRSTQVVSPRSCPSQSSPASMAPLPQVLPDSLASSTVSLPLDPSVSVVSAVVVSSVVSAVVVSSVVSSVVVALTVVALIVVTLVVSPDVLPMVSSLGSCIVSSAGQAVSRSSSAGSGLHRVVVADRGVVIGMTRLRGRHRVADDAAMTRTRELARPRDGQHTSMAASGATANRVEPSARSITAHPSTPAASRSLRSR